MNDFIIVGGGVIGLMLARELARTKAKIVLIERQYCGQEASWAGGGILSALYPWLAHPQVNQLINWSQQVYPALVSDLQRETGIDSEFIQTGALWCDVEMPPSLSFPTSKEYYEPELNSNIESVIYAPTIAQIRNPRLLQALKISVKNLGVELIENNSVSEIKIIKSTAVGVETVQGFIAAKKIIITAGAWSAELLRKLNIELAIKPVLGQMLLFKAVPALVRHIILRDESYLIPRQDGHILVGSTVEETGFNKTITQQAYQFLYQQALGIIPILKNYSVVAQWAGLRPGTPAGVPLIGKFSAVKNLYINAGHYRNGLAMAPASAQLMADYLLERPPAIPIPISSVDT